LSNASKFTCNGQIVVTANRFGPAVAIAVRDTGIGVPVQLRDEIFKPFTQGEEGLSKSYSGTGLGLAIVRSHAAALGGTVQCESTPGKGSVFTLTIAAHRSAPTENTAAA
jgi:signal transduction histidine kinase